MPYVLTIATPEGRDLVVAALRSAADQRTRVARQAAGKVAADKRAGGDVRSAAVKVTLLLAEANTLSTTADELEALEELAILSVARDGSIDTTPIPTPTLEPVAGDDEDDDGLSEAAHRAAELAGLTAVVVDPDGEDVETGATLEDEPDGDVEDVLPS